MCVGGEQAGSAHSMPGRSVNECHGVYSICASTFRHWGLCRRPQGSGQAARIFSCVSMCEYLLLLAEGETDHTGDRLPSERGDEQLFLEAQSPGLSLPNLETPSSTNLCPSPTPSPGFS